MSGYVVGVGCSRGCPAAELLELVRHVLGLAGVRPGEVDALATIDVRAGEPALDGVADAMAWPVLLYGAAALATVEVPSPSAVVSAHVGTPSVAEAAALLSVLPGRLVVNKHRSAHATCALGLRRK